MVIDNFKGIQHLELKFDHRTNICGANRTGKTSAWEGKTFSGQFLMETGLELNLRGLWDSKVIKVVKN